ncbi:methyl-accepting chemotaxis protein [Frateuria aurantia DSM 6220]|uniref:Methyl-accepting chemotaxis protein n=1 Tax=Frateuria aurantia (strain ATCC 33424 / DSM 6220 / KCTC 2777 / LMG 1558 / NBRC 3245 / NCIMB 13370) TaxID=767434 RepID=H8L2S1_FRAAD|nr:methyl-accepting chemotaxis protein [Frateuria aurantia DSM 6220]
MEMRVDNVKSSRFFSKWFSVSIKAKLISLFSLLGVMLIVGAYIGLGGMSRASDDTGRLYNEQLVPLRELDEAARALMNSFLSLGEADYHADDKHVLQQKLHDVETSITAADHGLAQVEKGSAIWSSTERKDWTALRGSEHDLIDSMHQVIDGMQQGQDGIRDSIYNDALPMLAIFQSNLRRVINDQRDTVESLYTAQVHRLKLVRLVTLVALVLGLLLAAVVVTVVIRSIVRALHHTVTVANAISKGDLGHALHVESQDELGVLLGAFKAMDERLSMIVGQVRQSADLVRGASDEIARGSDDLAKRTQDQAASLEETAASMEEMTSTVKQNAENASHANQLVKATRDLAERGNEGIARTGGAMTDLRKSSRRIADIVGLIDEIAFQTNLLSLNAAVEAARAGDQGRGFAVVASEVRNLAQRSAEAAKEIKALISDSMERVDVVGNMAEENGKVLGEIVESVRKVSDIVAEIAAASYEQSAGIDQVNSAVTQMDDSTQQNAALVEETAASARMMQEQATDLAQQMAFFRVNGSAGARTVASPSAGPAVPASAAVPAKPAPTHAPAPAAAGDSDAIWKEF